jgi:hypothetical protein
MKIEHPIYTESLGQHYHGYVESERDNEEVKLRLNIKFVAEYEKLTELLKEVEALVQKYSI